MEREPAVSHITNDPADPEITFPCWAMQLDDGWRSQNAQHRNHRRQYLQRRYLRRFCLYHVDSGGRSAYWKDLPEGERAVPVCEFYTGPGRTVRDRCEVCTGFLVKKENFEGWTGHYVKYGKRKAMEIATLGCAVRVKLSEDKKRIEDVRLGYGVAGPTPLRCRKAEEGLKGCETTDADAVLTFGKKLPWRRLIPEPPGEHLRNSVFNW